MVMIYLIQSSSEKKVDMYKTEFRITVQKLPKRLWAVSVVLI